MANPPRRPRRAAPSSPDSQPIDVAPLRFADTPVSVRLIPEKKTPNVSVTNTRRLVIAAVIASVIVFGMAFAVFILPQSSIPFTPVPPLVASVKYVAPQYVAVYDEGAIDVTLQNNLNSPITVTVTLVFDPDAPVSAVLDESTSVTIEKLSSGSQTTRRIKFLLNDRPTNNEFAFQVKVESPQGVSGITPPQKVNVTPLIPMLNRLLTFLTGSSALAALSGLFWDQIKKLFSSS